AFGKMLGNALCNVLIRNGHQSNLLDQPAFNRNRLQAEKLIDFKMLEQLTRVQIDSGCSRGSQGDPLLSRVPLLTRDLRSKNGEGKRIRLQSKFAGRLRQFVSPLCGRTDSGKRGAWRFITHKGSGI